MIDRAKTAATYSWPVVLVAVLLLAGVLILPDRWLLDRWLLERKKGPALELLRDAMESYEIGDTQYGYVESFFMEDVRGSTDAWDGRRTTAAYFSGAGVFAPETDHEIKQGVFYSYDTDRPRKIPYEQCGHWILQQRFSTDYFDAWPEWESCFGAPPEPTMVLEGEQYRYNRDDGTWHRAGLLTGFGEGWESGKSVVNEALTASWGSKRRNQITRGPIDGDGIVDASVSTKEVDGKEIATVSIAYRLGNDRWGSESVTTVELQGRRVNRITRHTTRFLRYDASFCNYEAGEIQWVQQCGDSYIQTAIRTMTFVRPSDNYEGVFQSRAIGKHAPLGAIPSSQSYFADAAANIWSNDPGWSDDRLNDLQVRIRADNDNPVPRGGYTGYIVTLENRTEQPISDLLAYLHVIGLDGREHTQHLQIPSECRISSHVVCSIEAIDPGEFYELRFLPALEPERWPSVSLARTGVYLPPAANGSIAHNEARHLQFVRGCDLFRICRV